MERPGIPFADHPDISFFYTGENKWKAEALGQVIDLKHGTPLTFELFDQTDWIFVSNQSFDTTEDLGLVASEAYFEIYLSGDEERFSVKIKGEDWEMDLGDRVHLYIVLALIRKKLEDHEAGYVQEDQGWLEMEELTQIMSREFRKEVDAYNVNLQIHRLRKQLAKMNPYGYLFTDIIERRKGVLRLAHPYFRLKKEAEVLGEVLPP